MIKTATSGYVFPEMPLSRYGTDSQEPCILDISYISRESGIHFSSQHCSDILCRLTWACHAVFYWARHPKDLKQKCIELEQNINENSSKSKY